MAAFDPLLPLARLLSLLPLLGGQSHASETAQAAGWREFVGEVGIIVLGVLIALGAQQLAETINTHQRIAQTRAALDAELSRDLAAFEWRFNQRHCVRSRVVDLDRWARGMAAGDGVKLRKELTPPIYFAINTTVWQASESDAGQMPVETKLNYANMYAAFRSLDEVMRNERDAWDAVSGYKDDKDLTREELHSVRRAILDFQSDDELLDVFQQRLHSDAASWASGRSGTSKAALDRKWCNNTIVSFASRYYKAVSAV